MPYPEDFLKRMGAVNSDIQGSAIVSVQGFPICSVLARDVNDGIVSAMSAAILSVSERTLKELARGDLKRILVDGADGKIILSKVGSKAILCTLAKSDASLGMVFLNIQSVSKKLAEILDGDDEDDYGYITSYPYIPPGPPGAGSVAVRKEKPTELEKDAEFEPYCKHCGAKLAEGQTICHVCRKKV
ncbi:MAG: hypothetical protein CEE43_05180 [Promethearchaeota archaeon Loki_b32]|nr:MAG: hypothetical protein CEE43_05180 [Candidatus Lokiarchaeota archaeon Loki_b32]